MIWVKGFVEHWEPGFEVTNKTVESLLGPFVITKYMGYIAYKLDLTYSTALR